MLKSNENKSWFVILAVSLLFLFVLTGRAQGISSYRFSDNASAFSTNPTVSPWIDLPSSVTIGTQSAACFAYKTGYDKNKTTILSMTFIPDCPAHTSSPVRRVCATATYHWWQNSSGGWVGGPGGAFSTRHQVGNNDWMRVDASFDPKPEWCVIEINNLSDSKDYIITTVSASTFDLIPFRGLPDNVTLCIDTGRFDRPGESGFECPEFWFFPTTVDVPIDTNETPTFSASPATGNWSYEFVYENPYGDPQPQGGVKWVSDGNGLSPEHTFDMTFSISDVNSASAATSYNIFVYDVNDSNYTILRLDTRGPTEIIPGDLDKSFYVNFDDFALIADNWLECNNSADPNCTWGE